MLKDSINDNILYNQDKMKKIFIENIHRSKKILIEEKSKEIKENEKYNKSSF